MGCPPLTTLPRSLPPPPPQSASPGAVIVISVQPAPWGSMEKLEGGKKALAVFIQEFGRLFYCDV